MERRPWLLVRHGAIIWTDEYPGCVRGLVGRPPIERLFKSLHRLDIQSLHVFPLLWERASR